MESPKYLQAVRDIMVHLETTQLPAVEKAADLIIEALTNGGSIHCSEIGHGGQGDFIHRAGGLAAVLPFSYSFNVNAPVPECLKDRPRTQPYDYEIDLPRFALYASNLRAGDVMLVSSVSGRNKGPIELTLACHDMGIKVIGFTSLDYTAHVQSAHPCGKKLCEVVDAVIDIGAPYGDAAVEIPGYEYKMCPVSGVAMDISGWMIWERVMERMAAAGNPPSAFISYNREGGPAHLTATEAEFNRRGY